jgi:type I restriction enzyme, S subunit
MKNEWPKTPLGEVLRAVSGDESVDALREYRLLGVRLDGKGPFLRETISGTQTSATKLHRVAEGDFIYSRLFACRGAFGVIDRDLDGCHVSGEFPTFTAVPGRIDVNFLSYWFRLATTIARVNEDCTGSTPLTRNRFKEQFFLALEIPLPPLAEQRRVVALIKDLAAQIHDARALRRQAIEEVDALRASLLRSAIQDCRANEIELADVCEALIDNLHSNPRYVPSGIPCIRSPDVGWGDLNLDVALRTDEVEYLRRTARGEPKAGDIVFVREGGGTGKCALVFPGQRFSLGQRVMMLRPNEEKVLPRFLLYQLLSPLVKDDQIDRLSKGSASPHLNIGALRRFRFRLPTLSEQQRIVAELDALQVKIDALKRLQAETAVALNALLPGILDCAFKGGL